MNCTFLRRTIGIAGLCLIVNFVPLSPAVPVLPAIAQSQSSSMTLADLETILEAEADDIQGGEGQWQLTLKQGTSQEPRTIVVLADETNNRMRIVTPVVPADQISAPQLQNILLANFHTALDARYALLDDVLVSVFVHPLNSLEEDYLRSALVQVSTLADTFGTTYSSGEIGFGPGDQSRPQPENASDRRSI